MGKKKMKLKVHNSEQPKMMTANNTKDKKKSEIPSGISKLAILTIILGFLGVFEFILFLFVSATIDFYFPSIFMILAIMLILVFSILLFFIAYGFIIGSRWSWFLAIIILMTWIIVNITRFIISIITSTITPSYKMSETFQLFIIRTGIGMLISLLICGAILFYLTRSYVRDYFNVGQLGSIVSLVKTRKKPIIIIVALFIVTGGMLVWGFTPTSSEIKVVNITITPENPQPEDEITVTAEISGGSPIGDDDISIIYASYFGVLGSGSRPMKRTGDSTYTWTPNIQYNFSNDTEIWFMIYKESEILAEHTIQIGHIETSNNTSLTITNITQVPKKPTSETSNVKIQVDITSNANITSVSLINIIFAQFDNHPGGGTGSMQSIDNDTYSGYIHLFSFGGRTGSSGEFQNQAFGSGTKVYYRIVAKDEEGNTAVATKSFLIS